MRRFLVRLLLASALAALPKLTFGQEVAAFIVEGPRISRTAFTNWENIELTYIVRYMKGYEPLLDDMKPRNMVFGPLELDPEFADNIDVRNKRSSGNESYFDVVYHLRYIKEKKEELEIPGQKFSYIELQAGKERTELPAKHFETQKFLLAYRTVLTRDADDIKDPIDFGSFSGPALRWKVASGVVLFFGLIFSLLIFRKPVVVVHIGAAHMEGTVLASQIKLEDVYRNLENGVRKIQGMSASDPAIRSELGAVCNNARLLIRLYMPHIGAGATNAEIASKLKEIQVPWVAERLIALATCLKTSEDFLYHSHSEAETVAIPILAFGNFWMVVQELHPYRVHLHTLWFRVKETVAGPFRRRGWWPWKS